MNIDELLNYARNKDLEIKVARVYCLCLKMKKFALADKIKHKYFNKPIFRDDLIIATEMAWRVKYSFQFPSPNQSKIILP